jgi:hypothetical protein
MGPVQGLAIKRLVALLSAVGLLLGGGALAVTASGAGEDPTVLQYGLNCKTGDSLFAYEGNRGALDANNNGFLCGHARATPQGTVYTGPYYDDFD